MRRLPLIDCLYHVIMRDIRPNPSMTPYASQIPCFEIAAVARVPRRFSFAAAWFRGTRKLVAPIDLPRRRIPCRALQSRYLAVCVRPVSAVQGPPVLHAPLAHKYRDMTGRRTDGDFARTHQHSVQPWQVPRLQVQSACRSREQRFLHGDEILVGVEHDVAHAGTTEPITPAEQSKAGCRRHGRSASETVVGHACCRRPRGRPSPYSTCHGTPTSSPVR